MKSYLNMIYNLQYMANKLLTNYQDLDLSNSLNYIIGKYYSM